ncbi:MAG: nitrous oxide reductase accessory protein NosL [Chitinophagaceae bacterium]|nr:nitrous oxide reductase accessory protein NosL [Chitinophagaceae bacterium]
MKNLLIVYACCLGLMSCSSGPSPIAYRQDECVFCKMTIMDAKYGCQIMNNKGKAYNFDDLSCLIGYLKADIIDSSQIKGIYVSDYLTDGLLIQAETAFYVASAQLRSPMAGNIAAFSNSDSAKAYAVKWGGTLAAWKTIKSTFQ